VVLIWLPLSLFFLISLCRGGEEKRGGGETLGVVAMRIRGVSNSVLDKDVMKMKNE
jgi:hypothetical protein